MNLLKPFGIDPEKDEVKAIVSWLLEKFPTLTLWWLSASLLIGMVCLGLTVGQADGSRVGYIGVELLIAGAATVFGVVMGFLFGIPRTIISKKRLQDTETSPTVQANTNLEDISDWLTKILVGVGLTQFRDIVKYLKALVNIVSPGFDHSPAPEATTYATLALFSMLGFLLGWLATRLHLGRSMVEADFVAVSKRIDDLVSHQKLLEQAMGDKINVGGSS